MAIHCGHLLTPTILNKMLKTLEAPSMATTIFFDNHKNAQLLPTIESRAIQITIPLGQKKLAERATLNSQQSAAEYLLTTLQQQRELFSEEQHQLLATYFKEAGQYHPLIDQLKRDQSFQAKLYHFLLEQAPALNNKSYRHCERLLDEVKWFAHTKSFNSPTSLSVANFSSPFKTIKDQSIIWEVSNDLASFSHF